MAYQRPDIFIEEILGAQNVPVGVSTSVASFLGITQRGPSNRPVLVTSLEEFRRVFGDPVEGESIFYSVRSFFENGGASAYIVRLSSAQTTPVVASASFDNLAGDDVIRVKAGYRGEDSVGLAGNDLVVELRRSTKVQAGLKIKSAVAQGDTSIVVGNISGIIAGMTIKVTDGTDSDYVVVQKTSSVFDATSSSVVHTIDLESAIQLTAGYSVDDTIQAEEYDLKVLKSGDQLELFERLSLNPLSDFYLETVINDSETGSRFINVEDLLSSSSLSAKEVKASDLSGSFSLANGTSELVGFASSDIVGVQSSRTGLFALDAREQVNLVSVPQSLEGGRIASSMMPVIHQAALAYCEGRMNCFAILDAPRGLTPASAGAGSIGEYRDSDLGVDSFWGALYYPHVAVIKDGGKEVLTVPPSGAVAGLYSRVDQISPPLGSVAASPAGYGDFGLIRGIRGLEVNPSDADHGPLNVKGINCLRRVRGADGNNDGVLVLGARTLSSTDDFRYINVRRLMIFVERQVKELARPFLFKNNSVNLRREMRSVIEGFLGDMFRRGQLAGASIGEAFYVKIDDSNNTPDLSRQGILVGEIGIAALRPAEFIVFKFSQTQAGTSVEE